MGRRISSYNDSVAENKLPKRKHLKRLERIYASATPEIYFVTVCTKDRRSILANDEAYMAVASALEQSAQEEEWLVGRYVVMPDHIHFFSSPSGAESSLSGLVGRFKSLSTRAMWKLGYNGAVWQEDFFDHLLRSGESYKSKWEYVQLNPFLKGLCESPDDWRYQGEITLLEK